MPCDILTLEDLEESLSSTETTLSQLKHAHDSDRICIKDKKIIVTSNIISERLH